MSQKCRARSVARRLSRAGSCRVRPTPASDYFDVLNTLVSYFRDFSISPLPEGSDGRSLYLHRAQPAGSAAIARMPSCSPPGRRHPHPLRRKTRLVRLRRGLHPSRRRDSRATGAASTWGTPLQQRVLGASREPPTKKRAVTRSSGPSASVRAGPCVTGLPVAASAASGSGAMPFRPRWPRRSRQGPWQWLWPRRAREPRGGPAEAAAAEIARQAAGEARKPMHPPGGRARAQAARVGPNRRRNGGPGGGFLAWRRRHR